MARGILTETDIAILKENPYVIHAEGNRIIYTAGFKEHFMEEYLKGKKPLQIFTEAGFDPAVIGKKRIERAAARWREAHAAGTLSTYDDQYLRHKYAEERKRDKQRHVVRIVGKQKTLIKNLEEELANKNEQLKLLREKVNTQATHHKEYVYQLRRWQERRIERVRNEYDAKMKSKDVLIDRLSAENELLKRVCELKASQGKMYTGKQLFDVVKDILDKYPEASIKDLYELAGVSRAMYYYYLESNNKNIGDVKK